MRYVFLTACRNEQAIIADFLKEFCDVIRAAGLIEKSILYVVDDLSTDATIEILEAYRRAPREIPLEIIRAPTNFGNQGALFHGLSKIAIAPSDTLVTFDCDGEDDVRQIASIIKLGIENPDKIVYIERGRRKESLIFRIAFVFYKTLFRFLTRQTVIPNNFLLIPGRFVPFIRKMPLTAVHFAYAILKMRFPSVSTQRDRRARYGGSSSQNLFMVASHGLVGLMVFYETVIAKLLVTFFAFLGFSLVVVALALVIPNLAVQRSLLWVSVAIAVTSAGFFSLMMASALALIFKMAVFTLSRYRGKEAEPPGHPVELAAAPSSSPTDPPRADAS